jgi:hypothetical protein
LVEVAEKQTGQITEFHSDQIKYNSDL